MAEAASSSSLNFTHVLPLSAHTSRVAVANVPPTSINERHCGFQVSVAAKRAVGCVFTGTSRQSLPSHSHVSLSLAKLVSAPPTSTTFSRTGSHAIDA